MNTLILENEDFLDENTVKIYGRRAKHILEIKKLSIGSAINTGLINGNLGIATVKSIGSTHIILEVSLNDKPPAPLSLSLIIALPRPKVLKKILQTATSLGIKKIYLINSWKVEKSYWQTNQLSEKNIREQLLLGLEQSCETVAPEVIIRKQFKPFLEDEIGSIVKDSIALIAHPCEKIFDSERVKKNIVLAIGPEGGYTEYEFKKFIEMGFQQISLGKRIQRVETILPLLVGKLCY
ncbi:MAG: 16S rRNA (uracil(1498)-N(3))-methyltransferase [Cellvibrionales bacterium]|jgi:16S rRNA (uracil1498-N3)-methyltransferase|nr:16S rRNA (uracil(1498)-N(3))-methyltransferase [Cellvibrionales bacterium]